MRLLFIPILVLLGACASQPVSTTYYLLRSDVELTSQQLNPSSEFGFGLLQVADYIDRPGMVLETGAGEIHSARNHQWAEPLRSSLKSLFSAEVSARLGENVFFGNSSSAVTTTIDIEIDQLHGNRYGEAVLVAYWRLSGADQATRVYQFAETGQLQSDGYGALAQAEKKLLQQFARQIADSLRPVGAGSSDG